MAVRCPACRTRRATFTSLLKHIAASGHKLCTCNGVGGYHHPHRPGSPLCEQNPRCTFNRALREDATPDELIDILLDSPGVPSTSLQPPF